MGPSGTDHPLPRLPLCERELMHPRGNSAFAVCVHGDDGQVRGRHRCCVCWAAARKGKCMALLQSMASPHTSPRSPRGTFHSIFGGCGALSLRPGRFLGIVFSCNSFVPQHDELFPHLTVRETLEFDARMLMPHLSDSAIQQEVRWVGSSLWFRTALTQGEKCRWFVCVRRNR